MQLFGQPWDVKRTSIALLAGLAAFAGSFFAFDLSIPPYKISLPWSLFLPMLAALAYGCRYALIAAIPGGAGLFHFFLWPTNGWANLVNVVIYCSWYIAHGYAADLYRMRPSFWNNRYFVQFLCSLCYVALLLTVFPRMFSLNPPFWYPAAFSSIPPGIVAAIAIKQTIAMFSLIFFCDMLLNMQAVPRMLGIPVLSSNRLTGRIVAVAALMGFVVVVIEFTLEAAFSDNDSKGIIEYAASGERIRTATLILLISMVAGMQLAKFMRRRLEDEERIKESEQRYRTLFESAADAIFLMQGDLFVDCNPRTLQMFGCTREQIIGAPPDRFSPHLQPDGRASKEKTLEKINAAMAREPQFFEWKHIKYNGELFDAEVTLSRINLTSGPHLQAIVRDVSERKRAEEALQLQSRLQEVLMNISTKYINMPLEAVDRSIRSSLGEMAEFVEADRAFVFDYDLHEQTARATHEWYGADLEPRHSEFQSVALATLPDWDVEKHLSGEPIWIPNTLSLHSGTLRDMLLRFGDVKSHLSVPIMNSGECIGFVGFSWTKQYHVLSDYEQRLLAVFANMLVNIRQRKQMEEALRSGEEKLRLILAHSPDAVYVLNFDGKALYANPAVSLMTGYSNEELMQMLFSELLHPEDRPVLVQQWSEWLAGKPVPSNFSFRVIDRAGAVHWTEDRVIALPWEGKMAVLNYLWDVTEQKRAAEEKNTLQAQLLQAQKMEAVGQLAGGIAHDFNNILTAIISSGELLKMKMGGGDPLNTYVGYIMDASKRGASLVKGLLAFSRKETFCPARWDLNELIVGIKPLIMRIVPEDIDVQIKTTDTGLTVMADKTQMEQVIINLVANARDAMPSGGMISISTEFSKLDANFVKLYADLKQGKHAIVSVSDTGTGMDEKTRERIFEPFFTTKEVGRGTGLGLSSVYGTVKQHNGSIQVYSTPGIGTTMKIYLPLISVSDEVTMEEEAILPQGGDETILFAEDDSTVRDVTKNLLEEFGYTVKVSVDGEDAVRLFRENKDNIQLAVLDIIMPKMNGKEVYEQIKEMKTGIKTIFMSGYTADILRTRFIFEDGLHFISKPVSPFELLTMIRKVLDSRT